MIARLAKRQAILEVVKGLCGSGVPAPDIRQVLQSRHQIRDWVFCSAPGNLEGEAFVAAVTEERRAEGRGFDSTRFFCETEELIKGNGQTYALTNQWGSNTAGALNALLEAYPDRGVSCSPAESGT